LRAALQAVRQESRICVIVVETSVDPMLPGSGVWMDIEVAAASDHPLTQQLRQQYQQDKAAQRFFR